VVGIAARAVRRLLRPRGVRAPPARHLSDVRSSVRDAVMLCPPSGHAGSRRAISAPLSGGVSVLPISSFSLPHLARLGCSRLRTIGLTHPVTICRVRLADIGGVIVRLTSSSCVADTQHTPAFVRRCRPMTDGHFNAAYITTRTLGMLFPFRNNFATRFR
jgi:hypothetical protein